MKLFLNYCQIRQTHSSQSFTINWLLFVTIMCQNYSQNSSLYWHLPNGSILYDFISHSSSVKHFIYCREHYQLNCTMFCFFQYWEILDPDVKFLLVIRDNSETCFNIKISIEGDTSTALLNTFVRFRSQYSIFGKKSYLKSKHMFIMTLLPKLNIDKQFQG